MSKTQLSLFQQGEDLPLFSQPDEEPEVDIYETARRWGPWSDDPDDYPEDPCDGCDSADDCATWDPDECERLNRRAQP